MKVLAILAALFLGIAGGYFAGTRRAPIREYYTRVDTLVRDAVRLDTLWKTRKVRYDSVLSRYDTVRMHDTVVVDSVVYVPREVADSIVVACRLVVMTCEAQKANLTARLSVAESLLAAPHKRTKPLLWALGGIVIGAAIK